MTSILFLTVSAGVMLVLAARNSQRLRQSLKSFSGKTQVLPQMIGLLIIAAQVSELVKMFEHISIVNVTAALLTLAIVTATKSGTGDELG